MLVIGVKEFEVLGELLSSSSHGHNAFIQAIEHCRGRRIAGSAVERQLYHAIRIVTLKTLPYVSDKTFAAELGE